MKAVVSNNALRGTVRAIPSKSYAHRAFICAALSDGVTEIYCPTVNDDILATVRCLNELGASIVNDGNKYTIYPIKRVSSDTIRLDCGESGSTFRFLLPVSLVLGAESEFILRGNLANRPISPLYEELIGHGARLSPVGSNPFFAGSGICGGDYVIDGGISSQFISGLLLSLPLSDRNSTVTVVGKTESRTYIDMTMSVMNQFGVTVTEENGVLYITPKSYITPGRIDICGDWSNSAFYLAAGAFSEYGVTVRGLDKSSVQGDSAICSLLCDFGAEVHIGGESVYVKKGCLRALTQPVDVSNIPDLVPIISVVASVSEGTTVLTGCRRLKYKESDRIAAVCNMINSLGGSAEGSDDTIIIKGKKTLSGGVVSSYGDHRIAMAAAVSAGVCEHCVEITGAEAVSKSYPLFFEDYISLDGKVSIHD